jgi:hypothetical protein
MQDALLEAGDHEAFISSSVYTDINGERQDPNVQLLDTLQKVMTGIPCAPDRNTVDADDATDECTTGQGSIQAISYVIHGQSTLMSNWEDPYYFTAAFPTLFLTGIGGHQDKRKVPVSLAAFADWALNHYSRRRAALIQCCECLISFTGSHVTNLYVPALQYIATLKCIAWKCFSR